MGAFMSSRQSAGAMRARELRKAPGGTEHGCGLDVLILSDLVRILFFGKMHFLHLSR
jgi:hypothetical protein